MAEDGPPAAVALRGPASALGLDVHGYARHALHADERAWVEKNCYIDVWIELLHALKLDPHAMLGVVVGLDFEDDQWTFFKPSHDELHDLYGLRVTELNVWRPLIDHAVEHLSAGRLISTEADAFWLPDTAGTDYRRQHTKSTIVLESIDVDARRLRYFHNAGYFELNGEDFDATFGVGTAPAQMPLFAELVRIDRIHRRSPVELALRAEQHLAAHHWQRAPDNPVERFRARFDGDLPWLREGGLARYHAWAFANTRQLGAACELAALLLRWLSTHEIGRYQDAIAGYEQVSSAAKTFILKGARAATSPKRFAADELFDAMTHGWATAREALDRALEQR